jgi:hypothetical protein
MFLAYTYGLMLNLLIGTGDFLQVSFPPHDEILDRCNGLQLLIRTQLLHERVGWVGGSRVLIQELLQKGIHHSLQPLPIRSHPLIALGWDKLIMHS